MSTDTIFTGLNPEQRRAVETLKGPVLILAGAGSGKTRTLTHRIAHLMAQGIAPWEILAVTFTNKAAGELKERISRILKLADASGTEATHLPLSGTFHSICARMLRRDMEHIGRERSFVIYDADDQEKLMTHVLREMKIAPEDLKPRAALAALGRWKSEAVKASEARSRASTFTEERAAEIYTLYQKKLRECNALDFDDLILETIRLLEECPDVLRRYQQTWKFLHVDEYQDTNHAQYLLLKLLSSAHRNICVIGDPDQSIYAFRGADIRNILDFTREYPDATEIKLERNYRSTQQILDAADGVISANPRRPEKKMWTERTDGTKIALMEVMDERREAEQAVSEVIRRQKNGMLLRNQAILYRTNAQSRQCEEACLRAGVPYRIIGGVKFYARREVKDLLAYLFAVQNPEDTISLLRIINVPSRKIGETTVARLQNFCNERSLSLWQAIKHIEMVDGIAESAKQRIRVFGDVLEEARRKSMVEPVKEVASWIMDRVGLEKFVRDNTEEGESRWENVLELHSVMRKYDHLSPAESLQNFLQEVTLVSEVDALAKEGSDALTLMTLHLCKGLEFSSVTIVGCEEGLLPHSSALMDREQMEEERRLLYVGMTRAKDSLTLIHTMSRRLWGSEQSNARSRFLDDLPDAVVDVKSDEMQSKYAWLTSSRPQKQWYQKSTKGSPNQDAASAPEDENQDWLSHIEERIGEGTRVDHRTLGHGTVLIRHGDVVEVRFDSGHLKKLALGVAPMRIVESQ